MHNKSLSDMGVVVKGCRGPARAGEAVESALPKRNLAQWRHVFAARQADRRRSTSSGPSSYLDLNKLAPAHLQGGVAPHVPGGPSDQHVIPAVVDDPSPRGLVEGRQVIDGELERHRGA